MNPNTQPTKVESTPILRVANVVVAGATYNLLCNASNARQSVYFENNGITTLWYGASSNVGTGSTASSMGHLDVGSQKALAGYGGPLYGAYTGTSNADLHIVKVFEY